MLPQNNILAQLASQHQPAPQQKPEPKWDYKTSPTGMNGEELPVRALGWRPDGSPDFGTGFKGWANGAASGIEEAYLKGWDEGGKIARENDYKSYFMPKLAASTYATVEIGKQGLGGLFKLLGETSLRTEQIGGFLAYGIRDFVQGKPAQDPRVNWEAARLTYNEIYNSFHGKQDVIRAEFAERLANGERPDIIAEDMLVNGRANPWVEFAGQIPFDPLNVDLFLNFFGKGRRALHLVDEVRKAFHTVDNPIIQEAIKAAAEATNDADAARAVVTALNEYDRMLKDAGETLTALQKPGRITGLSKKANQIAFLVPDSKRAYFANRAGEILSHIATVEKDPEAVLNILQAMRDVVGKDPIKKAEAFAYMAKFRDATSLFSEAGNETTLFVGKMMEKYGDNFIRGLEDLSGKPQGEIAEYLIKAMDGALDDLYPSAIDMIKAEEAVNVANKSGDISKITQRTAQLAEYAKTMSPAEKWVARAHATAQKTVVGQINKFFATVYMNWNPAFAARNGMQNSIQIFLDYGPGAFLQSADEQIALAEKFHGTRIFGTQGYESGTKVAEGVRKVEKTGLVEAIKAVWTGKGTRAASEVFETGAARKVVGHTYVQTFKNALEPLVKSLRNDPLFKDLPQEMWPLVKSELLNNYGDAEKAMEAIRASLATHTIDEFKNFDNVPESLRKFLEQSGIDREFMDTVLNASSKEESLQAAQALSQRLEEAAKSVYIDPRPVSPHDPVDSGLLKMQHSKIISEPTAALHSSKLQVTNEALGVASEAVSRIDQYVNDVTAKISAQTGVPTTFDLTTLKKNRNLMALTEWGSKTSKQLDDYLKVVRDLDSLSHENAPIEQLWGRLNFLEMGPMPPGMTQTEFRQAMWPKFKNYQAATWDATRNKALLGAKEYIKEVNELLAGNGKIPEDVVEALDSAIYTSKQWDNVAISDLGILVKEELQGPPATQIAQLANKYGISSATEAGIPLDKKLLNIINKYAQTSFVSLDEPISIHLAERAFAKKAGVALPEMEEAEQLVKTAVETAKIIPIKPEISEAVEAGLETLKGTTASNIDWLIANKPDTTMGKALAFWRDYELPELVEKMSPAEKTGLLREYESTKKLTPMVREIQKQAERMVGLSKPLVPPLRDGTPVTLSRALHENNLGIVKSKLLDYVEENFGKMTHIAGDFEESLKSLEKTLLPRMDEIRLISSRVAQENRNFTLLNYGMRSYADVSLSYLMPYEFWYNKSYTNWIQRLAWNPAILAGYGKYKDALSEVHAGLPEWWKYNINSNEITGFLGIEVDNPLYFNLEQTLWPLNGITGVDFNDPEKRVDWWTFTLDQLNRFGPSTWTPIQMLTGLSLYARGNKEAGDSWVGRLFPQSAAIKTFTGMETDPMVLAFQGGYDKYERRQIGKMLGQMVQDGLITQEQAQDAGLTQDGPIWLQASQMRNHARASGQATSFLFGVGFKPRTRQDIQIDQFYGEYGKLMNLRPNMSPEEFKMQMTNLETKYPFMDAVLLARRSGEDREGAYAYNVFSRIPPGQTKGLFEVVNIDPETAETFYKNKGDLSFMEPSERKTFMAGVINMGALLAIPSAPQRQEWTQARLVYGDMQDLVKQTLGEDIWDKVTEYRNLDQKQAKLYGELHPEVQSAFDIQNEYVISHPLLYKYYGGIQTLETYYYGQMYDELYSKYGKDIPEKWDIYYNLKLMDPRAAKAYYNKNLSAYSKDKAEMTPDVERYIARFGQILPDTPGYNLRTDFEPKSPQQEDLAQYTQQPQVSFEEWQQIIGPNMTNLIVDYAQEGKPLPGAARSQLDYLAKQYGMDGDSLFQEILSSYPYSIAP